jgi:hypothetical protein
MNDCDGHAEGKQMAFGLSATSTLFMAAMGTPEVSTNISSPASQFLRLFLEHKFRPLSGNCDHQQA